MSKIVETAVYQLAELSDAAREKARAWYREGGLDYPWHEWVYADFLEVCNILGIHINLRAIPITRDARQYKPRIWFSGFSSQGDGACFEGRYTYRKNASREIRSYAPNDIRLHAIVDRLQAIQRRNFYQLRAEARHHGHYYHEYCMAIAVERDSPTCQDMTTDAEEDVVEALRDLARWLYRHLEREYEDLTSDESVDEAIIANEYTFTESGRRFG